MTKLGKKEKGRFAILAEIAEICSGVQTLPGRLSLPDLLDYKKTPLTTETMHDVHDYVRHLEKLSKKIRFQINLAHWMRNKRKIKLEKSDV